MFLESIKEIYALTFYLAITYALSVRILGTLTLKAEKDISSTNTISYKTQVLLAVAFLNLIGVPPFPIFWTKSAFLATLIPKVTATQLYIIVAFTNVMIVLYVVMWFRNLYQNDPKSITSKEVNYSLVAHSVALAVIQLTAPYWLLLLL